MNDLFNRFSLVVLVCSRPSLNYIIQSNRARGKKIETYLYTSKNKKKLLGGITMPQLKKKVIELLRLRTKCK